MPAARIRSDDEMGNPATDPLVVHSGTTKVALPGILLLSVRKL